MMLFDCRPFKCKYCGTNYYRKNVLKAHMVKCKFSTELNLRYLRRSNEMVAQPANDS